jgi:hypothetical protein
MNMITTLVPDWKEFNEWAVYCFEVNGSRIKARCSDKAKYVSLYQYDFISTDSGINANPDCTGEIMPVRGSLRLHDKAFDGAGSSWFTYFSVRVWPKTELSMTNGHWRTPEDIQGDIFQSHGSGKERSDHFSKEYSYPKSATDIDVLTIKSRLWGHLVFGDYKKNDRFYTELTEHIVIMVDFDASPCWPSDALPPADIKSHVMDFFLDYLEHFDIIPLGSVPDAELPPLGFYPAKRDEKEIDADGMTIKKEVEAEPVSPTSNLSW